ncbi:MAG: molybdopterin-dependent oxidoreductase, partial [candidate division Zixibacteria bacterium]|nr:molybdopterin-dependent oxidoreductase [candidate division Zixibacteria bacterium]
PKILPDGMENNQKNRQNLAEQWGVEGIPDETGMNTNEMLKAAADGNMGALVFYGSDPVGFYPDRELASNAVKNAAFKISIDTFLTETGRICDVVLPLAAFPEYDGSIISTEGRIQYFEKAYKSAYSSAEGWRILLRLMQRLDFERDYNEPADIWAEMSSESPIFAKKVYKGMRFGGIFLELDFDELPYNDVSQFESDGAPSPDENRPFILTYGSSVYQRRHLTYYAESMDKIDPGPKLYMNPDNAVKINLDNNDTIRVSSEHGSLTMRMTVDKNIRPGTVFILINYTEAEVNSLISSSSDLTFVKVEKL